MLLDPLPSQASWQHRGVRDAFEVVWPTSVGDAHRLRGATTGVEAGAGWTVSYDVELDAAWRTRTVVVRVVGRDGAGEVLLERDDADRWSVDGLHWPDLDGVSDVALESSVATGTLPLQRLDLHVGEPMAVDAVLVRLDLRVARVRQTYELLERDDGAVAIACAPAAPGRARTVVHDSAGLVTDDPEVATRCS